MPRKGLEFVRQIKGGLDIDGASPLASFTSMKEILPCLILPCGL
jgi:hypothetical protein